MMNRTIQSLITTAAVLTTLTACGQTQMPVSASLPMVSAPMTTQVSPTVTNRPSLMVKFKAGVSRTQINEFHAKYGTHTLQVLPNINVHVITLDQTVGLQSSQLLKYIQQDRLVDYAEINGTMQLAQQRMAVDFSQMVGQQVSLTGTYTTSRSGALLQTPQGVLSIVDNNNRPVMQLAQLPAGRTIKITGVITPVVGFNVTQNLGVLPMQMQVL